MKRLSLQDGEFISLFNFVEYTKLKNMSLKIFTLQLTGKLKNAEKIESERKNTRENFEAFKIAEGSEELKDYRELDGWIKSGACDRKKKEIEALVFKGSQEYKQLKEFMHLQKNKSIRNFFSLDSSDDLKRFRKIKESENLNDYWEISDISA